MRTPSLCGVFLTNKRSVLAFTWTITTVLTLLAMITAIVMTVHVHARYKRMEHYYEELYSSGYYDNQDDGDEKEGEGEGDAQREFEEIMQLSQMASGSMTFVALYTTLIALTLALYGSTAIVGFTSLKGVYIAPCFSSTRSSDLKVGIFGGAIVFFANLLLLCAVFFGEVRVEDWNDHRDEDAREPYEVERIATVLAVTFMFLSALYTIFAILLFLFYSSDDRSMQDMQGDGVVTNKQQFATMSVAHERKESFITMSQES
jgi:hypothetical protein